MRKKANRLYDIDKHLNGLQDNRWSAAGHGTIFNARFYIEVNEVGFMDHIFESWSVLFCFQKFFFASVLCCRKVCWFASLFTQKWNLMIIISHNYIGQEGKGVERRKTYIKSRFQAILVSSLSQSGGSDFLTTCVQTTISPTRFIISSVVDSMFEHTRNIQLCW